MKPKGGPIVLLLAASLLVGCLFEGQGEPPNVSGAIVVENNTHVSGSAELDITDFTGNQIFQDHIELKLTANVFLSTAHFPADRIHVKTDGTFGTIVHSVEKNIFATGNGTIHIVFTKESATVEFEPRDGNLLRACVASCLKP